MSAAMIGVAGETPPVSEIEYAFDDLSGLIEATRFCGRALDDNAMEREAIEGLCNSMREQVKVLRAMTEGAKSG